MTAKKKIALCITHVQLGGAQKYVLTLARSLKDRYDVYILSSFEGPLQTLFTSLEGVHLVRIPQLQRAISPVKDAQAFFSLRRIFKQYDFALIHCNSPKVSFLGRIAAWSIAARAAIVYTVHLVDFTFPCRSVRDRVMLTIERILSRCTDCIVVNTAYEKELLLAAGFPEEKVTVVVPGIDTQPFLDVRATRRAQQFLAVPYRLLHITSFKRHKDPFFFMEFVRFLAGSYPVQVDVVGDGPLRKSCARYLRRHGLSSSVTLHGWQKDITRFMEKAAFLVITSERESLTYAALEACVAGLKIISFYQGTLRALIQEGCQGYFLDKDAQGAAVRVKNLLQNLRSVYTISEASRTFSAAPWDSQRMARQIQQVYERFFAHSESR